ncbi:MAG TPA: methylated-DNA--[protein]-cysteine S-methyltransferase [Verrucomicrobiae bacterium]|nr:methylated-DNA--[protein]-cysteine S-methyltransferase [Verrucomicrobiae bacterium]
MNDFDRIAKVIRHLDENHANQPSLGELAAAAGLSESHFHRLFHRWAAVTPKDFLQCLTVEHAKQRLRDSANVFDSAMDAGLSGPGRLHDLLVTIEAASPGEFKSGGEGMTIEWGMAESPFGWCSLGWNRRGICHLAFHHSDEVSAGPAELHENWPNARLQRSDSAARRQAKAIFNTNTFSPAPLKAFVRATPFQLRVWRALVRVPEGNVVTYRTMATAIGSPLASRAVGTACGSNPIAYLIPCHRVIRETGVVQGYRWGSTRKRALLAWESSRARRASGHAHVDKLVAA